MVATWVSTRQGSWLEERRPSDQERHGNQCLKMCVCVCVCWGGWEREGRRERESIFFSHMQGKVALSACNHRFVTVATSNRLMAISEKAKEKEILTVSHTCTVSSWLPKTIQMLTCKEHPEMIASSPMLTFQCLCKNVCSSRSWERGPGDKDAVIKLFISSPISLDCCRCTAMPVATRRERQMQTWKMS